MSDSEKWHKFIDVMTVRQSCGILYHFGRISFYLEKKKSLQEVKQSSHSLPEGIVLAAELSRR